MQLRVNPDRHVREEFYGQERLPIIVIDNLIDNAEHMIEHASLQNFVANSPLYPGIRAPAPASFQRLLLDEVEQHQQHFFGTQQHHFNLSVCHYSLVTTVPSKLKLLQRIPHFDAVDPHALAAVFYLFKGNWGGTSFYRHRKTGYEYIDESRRINYFRSLEQENDGPNIPTTADGYINGNTPLYERIAEQQGIFNRMIIYRRNALHSGAIPENFNFDPNPANGRLTISSFIDGT
ncbi:DUF6445 family protein [Neptunicella sp.]|uniref:DUF6445 family protein n=1 Tax=Neptunicella sp. TaxID=2125986 RepID=UPI003F68CC09